MSKKELTTISELDPELNEKLVNWSFSDVILDAKKHNIKPVEVYRKGLPEFIEVSENEMLDDIT